jgi:PHD/YefM family antitoxin component YafN of YafNO toxin-antitoxin module
MKTQFVTDEKGKKVAVILPIEQYQKMIEELEEADDIRLYDKAKAEGGEKILFSDYLKQRKGKK